MEKVQDSSLYSDSLKTETQDRRTETAVQNTINTRDGQGKCSENQEKNSAVWTTSSIYTLLNLYESKLDILETPKKKTRIWIAISDGLKDYDIEMSPDQVRWKINALTKRYKQCVDSGHHNKFKYFTQLDNIYSQYNVNCHSYYTISEMVHKRHHVNSSLDFHNQAESKAMIELRKNRLADKMEADRCQSRVQLEKQWLEYLKRQEEQRQLKDEIFARNLKLREEELQLRKRELEMREALELRKLQLKEKEQEDIIKLEREKCEMLKKIFSHRF